mgnify:CR=1 FL=1
MKIKIHLVFFLVSLIVFFACRKANNNYIDSDQEWLSGGKQTVFDATSSAFEHPFSGLSDREIFLHDVGDKAFSATFVTAPAPINSGLGPIYNNVSCISCHVKDGRGKAPEDGQGLSGLLLRISIPGTDFHGGPLGVPNFGGQLQNRAIGGKMPESVIATSYTYINGTFPDGTPYQLRKPRYIFINPYLNMPSDLEISPRMPPPVFGLGLIEAISESDILKHQDINDMDGDGISGKANYVYNPLTKNKELGRFGWKCGQPSLLLQSAGAFNEDMGITSFVFPVENSFGQTQYDGLNDENEISDSLLQAVAFYMQTLSVPARRNANYIDVLEGKKIFNQIGCNNCHINQFKTMTDMAFTSRSNQTIYPYSDFLLHDMGTDLADYRPDFLANGFEWRTPPLWGIGLTKKINGHENFLHDGRARSFEEAILWHGGEGIDSKTKYMNLNSSQRVQLIKFLESL